MFKLGAFSALAEELTPEDIGYVFDLLRDDVTRLVSVIQAAAGAPDSPLFWSAAHGVAGVAGTVGAKALKAICQQVTIARSDDIDYHTVAAEICTRVDVLLADITLQRTECSLAL